MKTTIDLEYFDMLFTDTYSAKRAIAFIFEPLPDFGPVFIDTHHDERGCYRFDFKANNNGHINKTKKTRGLATPAPRQLTA